MGEIGEIGGGGGVGGAKWGLSHYVESYLLRRAASTFALLALTCAMPQDVGSAVSSTGTSTKGRI